MNKSNTSKLKILSTIALCLLMVLTAVISSLTSGSVFAAPTPEQTGSSSGNYGINLQTPFTLSYVKDDQIVFNGATTKTMPELTGGVLTYYFAGTSGRESREVDIKQSALNYANSSTDSSVDRIIIENFSTETVGISKLKLTFYPTDENVSYTLEIFYRIFENSTQLAGAKKTTEVLMKFNAVLNNILVPIIIVTCSIGVIFAIYLGIKMARANNAEQREEAKKRVVYTVIAIAVGIALILLFKIFASNSLTCFGTDSNFFKLGK